MEVVVSPFLGVVFDMLSSLIARESRLQLDIKKDLDKLSKILSIIQSVLVDADVKQINDQRVSDWLSELKDAAYHAEDVLDECEYEGLLEEPDVGDMNCTQQVSYSLSECFNFKQIALRRKMGKKIRELIETFYEIDAERKKFQLIPGVGVTGVGGLRLREIGHLLTEPIICGRSEEKESIIQILLNNSSSPNILSVCPILGIGGLGKTTLAKLIFGDERVMNLYSTRIWICVSDDFDEKKITKMLIEHLSGEPCNLEALSSMQNSFSTLLGGRKFLLLLDDVWDDKRENWNIIIMSLRSFGANGSSIIVTTRLQTVVDSIFDLHASCIINPKCDLGYLSEHDSWSLFEHYALGVEDRQDDDLIGIGRVVVSRCKGIPLAINTAGCLLKSKRKEDWKITRDSEIWHLEGDTILPALRVSYYHLPPHYRRCFAYCSMYPKNTLLSKEGLIHAWMANGFIQSSTETEVEDIGAEVFNGLLQLFFFENEQKFKHTEVVLRKMHDLFHELACSVSKNECWRVKISEMKDISQRVRHASVACHSQICFPDILISLIKFQPYIRTLIFMANVCTYISRLDTAISRGGVKHLRMLQWAGVMNLKSIPPWIGYLRQLRYLNLDTTGIALIPEFVCELTNLQLEL